MDKFLRNTGRESCREERGTEQSWCKGRDFLAWNNKAEMSRKGFSFGSSIVLHQNNHMYSVSLNSVAYFELLAKLHVVAKGVN